MLSFYRSILWGMRGYGWWVLSSFRLPCLCFLFLHQLQVNGQERPEYHQGLSEVKFWDIFRIFSKKWKNLSFGYLLNKCFRTLKLVSPSFLKHFASLVLRNYSISEYSVRCCCSWFSINYCLSCNNPLVAIEMRCISQVQVTWDVLSFRKVGSCWEVKCWGLDIR